MGNIAVLFMIIVALFVMGFLIFVAIYSAREDWKDTPEGRKALKQQEAERRQKRLAETIVKSKIIDGYSTITSTGSISSSAGRAVVGNMIAGPLGVMVGASTGKRTYHENRYTIFKVWYADGSEKIETAYVGSAQWHKYAEKLEI